MAAIIAFFVASLVSFVVSSVILFIAGPVFDVVFGACDRVFDALEARADLRSRRSMSTDNLLPETCPPDGVAGHELPHLLTYAIMSDPRLKAMQRAMRELR